MFFLYYGWFLQNLEKGCNRTNMHTTVHDQVALCHLLCIDQKQQMGNKGQGELLRLLFIRSLLLLLGEFANLLFFLSRIIMLPVQVLGEEK